MSAARPIVAEAESDRQLILTGHWPTVDDVARQLLGLHVELVIQAWSSELLESVSTRTAAVVLVAPLTRTALPTAVALLRGLPEPTRPRVFVLVPSRTTTRLVRRLYGEDATAVIEWPAEASLLRGCLADTLEFDLDAGAMDEASQRLARIVEARLRLLPGLIEDLAVHVDDGVVTLRGEVGQLWQKERIEELVAYIPGVRSLLSSGLRVARTEHGDDELREQALALLEHEQTPESSTLTLAVEDGVATIAGSYASREEMRRTLFLLRGLAGIRSVVNLGVVSGDQNQQDRHVARRLRHLVEGLFPELLVDVAFFGGIAVLRGDVVSLAERRRIRSIVEDHPAVRRVVDKLQVVSSPAVTTSPPAA